jgi:hypothetical protein
MVQHVVSVVAHVKEALECSAIADIRRLEVEPDGKRVVLSGTVHSFFYKQLAQELVRNSAEGLEISNAISVEYPLFSDEPDWRA